MTAQEGPFFNLKAVVQQTGLKPDTLRAWERRYGLPSPERSAGGHRLFSYHDIETIKWLMARQREGLTIKRAVQLWQQIEAEGRDPLRAATPIATSAPPTPAPVLTGATILQMRVDWIEACLAYDEQRAEQIANQAFALYPAETVALELLQPAVAQVGEGWYQGNVTVQQEHFCSTLIVRRLEALVLAAPPPTHPGRILAACPPEEQHVISLLLLTFLLRRRGWEVVYLGANVPVERLETTVRVAKPDLVIMAAQQLHTAATLVEVAEVLRQEEVSLAYGGLIFNLLPALRRLVAGHFLGEQVAQVPRAVESLMAAPQPAPPVDAVPEVCYPARDHYDQRRGLIEARLVQRLMPTGIAPSHLNMANGELARNIHAALSLGNMDFLGTDIEWVEGLLRNYRLPTEVLYGYFEAYHEIAKEQLDERGLPIVEWLGRLVAGRKSS